MKRPTSDQRPHESGLGRRSFLQLATLTTAGGVLIGAAPDVAGSVAQAAVRTEPGIPTTPIRQRLPLGPSTFGLISGDLVNFDPEVDTWAPYFRSRVPRAARIAPFAATQAHPDLDPRPQMLVLDADSRGSVHEMRPRPYGLEGHTYSYRAWAYTDIWASWHGQVLERFTDEELGNRGLAKDYGVVEIPAVGWVDQAHRHGALALTCWFWPRETSEFFSRLIEQRSDGSFPVADALIRMRDYFGFDGIFINQEGAASQGLDTEIDNAAAAGTVREMLAYLKTRDPDFYVQWYDSYNAETGRVQYRNRVDEVNAVWLGTADRAGADSIWPNYDWPRRDPDLSISASTVEQLGLDPYQTVFTSLEIQKGHFNPLERMDDFAAPGRVAPTSFALFVPSEFWNRAAQRGLVSTAAERAELRRVEQLFWSGPTGDPSTSGRQAEQLPPGRADIDNPANWSGVAHSITERSGLSALPVTTSFDIGVGDGYWIEGRQVRSDGWNNMAAASLQPTWQYWTAQRGTDLRVALDASRAWDGGHSLRVTGTAEGGGFAEIKLFKTAITPPASGLLRMDLRTAPTVGEQSFRLGVVTEGDPSETRWFDLLPDDEVDGWTTSSTYLSSSDLAHGAIASLSLGIDAVTAGEHDVSIGLFSLTESGGGSPIIPWGFRAHTPSLERGRGQAYLAWDYRPEVMAWDIVQVLADGSRRWLGRVHNDVFFADGVIADAGAVVDFELTAIAHDLSRSGAACASLRF